MAMEWMNESNSSLELYQNSVFPLRWSSSHTLHLPLYSYYYMYLCRRFFNPYVIHIWPYLHQDSAACIDQDCRERSRVPMNEKAFRPPSMGGPAKNFYTKSENWLSVDSDLGLGWDGQFVQSTDNGANEKDKNAWNIVGPCPLFRTGGPW
jgi:hypothetical protein